MSEFVVEFSGIPIKIISKYEYIYELGRDYFTNREPVFSVEVSDEDIKKEAGEGDFSPDYIESICVHRAISEKLPYYDRMTFHGAAIEYKGKAYIFTAPSGTGKTTHISLWRRYIGEEVDIINGDKPIISFENGITVYGTPYSGKEGWQRNASAPLGGICVLLQGKKNEICRLEPKDAFMKLLVQTYIPRDKQAAVKTAELVRRLCDVDCYALSCDISQEAVKKSFDALTRGVCNEN